MTRPAPARRLRVAVASHDVFWPVRGGGGVRVFWVTRMLLSRGHRVTVVAPFVHREGLGEAFPGIRVRSIGRVTRFSGFKEALYGALMIRTFLRLLVAPVDVIYAQNVVAAFPAIWAGRIRGIPVLFDMIDLLTGYSRNRWVYRLGPTLERWTLRHADASVVTSVNLMTLGAGCGARRLEQVRHGVALDLFKPRPARRDCAVFIGGMEANDGLPLIPEAARSVLREFPGLKFLFVGEGKAVPALVQQARDLGLESNFEFRGWVDQSEIPKFLSRARLGLITSVKVAGTSYAYPLRSIEYMAMTVPFVASDLEGVREQAEKSGGGLLFEPGNAAGLAEAMLRILRNPRFAADLGRNGRKWALENADWERNAGRIAEMCEETAGNRDGRTVEAPSEK
jgi:glycosyltransferase involved in cell wall biosynthesis